MNKHTHENIRIVKRKGVGVTTLMSSTYILSPWNAHTECVLEVYTELLMRGAGKYSRAQFQDALGLLGSAIGISESDGRFTITVSALDENIPKTLSLLKTLLRKPSFSIKEFKNTKQYLNNQLDILKEDARYLAEQQFTKLVYDKRDSRYRNDITVLQKELRNVSLNEIKKLHNLIMENNSWVHTIGGHGTAIEAVKKFVIKEYGKYIASETPYISKAKSKAIALTHIPSKANIEFSLGYQTEVSFESKDYPALLFGLSVLGIPGGFSGRLMSTVREKEGLTYSIYLFADMIDKFEPITIRTYTFFAPKDTKKGLLSTLAQVDTIVKKGITEDELKRFKSILHTRNSLTNDALTKLMAKVHSHLCSNISEDEYALFEQAIQKLSVNDVNDALNEHLDSAKFSIAGAGPIKMVEKDIKALQ